MDLNASQFTKASEGTLVVEHSDLGSPRLESILILHDFPQADVKSKFLFFKADERDDEICGWNYRQVGGDTKLLIIND